MSSSTSDPAGEGRSSACRSPAGRTRGPAGTSSTCPIGSRQLPTASPTTRRFGTRRTAVRSSCRPVERTRRRGVTGSGIRAPRQGENTIRQLLFEAAEQWQECSFAVEELLELDARHVLVCGMALARAPGQGQVQEIPFVNLWTFEDGRAVRIESFVNRRKALAALDDAGD